MCFDRAASPSLTQRGAAIVLLAVVLTLATGVTGGADVVLEGVPRYQWWGGCAPTSAGMIVGYWNSPLRPFYDGDMSTWNSDHAQFSSVESNNLPTGVPALISSWEHCKEGYDYNQDQDPALKETDPGAYRPSKGAGKYTWSERDANCLADFMGANNGAVGSAEAVAWGLREFAAWDNPETPDFSEVLSIDTGIHYTFSSPDPWTIYTSEIDAGRPGVVLLRESTTGHAIAAYGYREVGEDRFMAVHDTWNDGLNWAPPGSFFEGGVEWWKWTPTWSVSSSYGAGDMVGDLPRDISYGSRGWTVDALVTVDAHNTPEPGTLMMVLLGLGGVAARLRRRHR